MQSQEPNSMAEEPVRDHIHQAILTLCVLDTTSKKAGSEGDDWKKKWLKKRKWVHKVWSHRRWSGVNFEIPRFLCRKQWPWRSICLRMALELCFQKALHSIQSGRKEERETIRPHSKLCPGLHTSSCISCLSWVRCIPAISSLRRLGQCHCSKCKGNLRYTRTIKPTRRRDSWWHPPWKRRPRS